MVLGFMVGRSEMCHEKAWLASMGSGPEARNPVNGKLFKNILEILWKFAIINHIFKKAYEDPKNFQDSIKFCQETLKYPLYFNIIRTVLGEALYFFKKIIILHYAIHFIVFIAILPSRRH